MSRAQGRPHIARNESRRRWPGALSSHRASCRLRAEPKGAQAGRRNIWRDEDVGGLRKMRYRGLDSTQLHPSWWPPLTTCSALPDSAPLPHEARLHQSAALASASETGSIWRLIPTLLSLQYRSPLPQHPTMTAATLLKPRSHLNY
jgi:hypothetical protein